MHENDAATATAALVDRYFAMWNEPEPAPRLTAIEAAWSPGASYVDPLFAAEGHAALGAMVDAFHAQYPGHRFRQVGALDAHHDRLRWGWELAKPDGSPPVAAGVDFAVLAADGKLREVTGFFAPLAAA